MIGRRQAIELLIAVLIAPVIGLGLVLSGWASATYGSQLAGASPPHDLLVLGDDFRGRMVRNLGFGSRDQWHAAVQQCAPDSVASTEAVATRAVVHDGKDHRVDVGWVEGPYFAQLGVSMVAGRGLARIDTDATHAPAEIVLSESLARAWFGSADAALGQTVRMRQVDPQRMSSFRVVGVTHGRFAGSGTGRTMAAWLHFLHWPDLLFPASQPDQAQSTLPPTVLLAKPDTISAARLQACLTTYSRHADWWGGRPGQVVVMTGVGVNLEQRLRMSESLPIYQALLLALVAVAWLSLLAQRLVDASARRHASQIRATLGEPPSRLLVRELRHHSAWVLLAGGLAVALIPLLSRTLLALEMDGSVAGVNAVQTTYWPSPSAWWLLCLWLLPLVVAPVWTTVRLTSAGAVFVRARKRRDGVLKSLVMAGMIAVSAVIALALGLRADLAQLLERPYSFDADGVRMYALDREDATSTNVLAQLTDATAAEPLQHAILAALEGTGVAAVLASASPIYGSDMTQIALPGHDEMVTAMINGVSRNYFDFFGIGVLRGYRLAERSARDEVWINQRFARQYFLDSDPLGQRIGVLDLSRGIEPVPHRIVGVVADAHYHDPRGEPVAMLYHPLHRLASAHMLFTRGDRPGHRDAALREAVATTAPRIKLEIVGGLPELVASGLVRETSRIRALSGMALILVVCASLGLLALLRSLLDQRRHELAVMRALGCSRLGLQHILWRRRMRWTLLLATVIATAVAAGLLHLAASSLSPWASATSILTGVAIAWLVVLLTSASASLMISDRTLRTCLAGE